MSEAFNPYHEWLGLSRETVDPSYYELLGVSPSESDTQVLTAAADRAMSKVRSFRPGSHAADWAKTLDQLAEARNCLTDPAARQKYDEQLAKGKVETNAGSAPGATPEIPERESPEQENPEAYIPELATAAAEEMDAETVGDDPGQSDLDPFLFPPEPAGDSSTPLEITEPSETVVPYLEEPAASIDPMAPVTNLPIGQPSHESPGVLDPMAPVSPQAPAPPPPVPTPVVPAQGSQSPLPTSPSIPTAIPVAPQGEKLAIRTRDKKRASWIMPVFGGISAGIALLLIAGVLHFMNRQSQQNQVAESNGAQVTVENTDGAEDENRSESTADVDGTDTPSDSELESGTSDQVASSDAPSNDVVEPEMSQEVNSEDDAKRDEPEPQPEIVPPTPAELATMKEALVAARAALTAGQLETAARQLGIAEPVARMPEHAAWRNRLQKLLELLQEFESAKMQSLDAVSAGSEIAISASTIVVVKEKTSENLKIEVAGIERTYPLNQLPMGLNFGLAADALGADNPRLSVLKGAYLAVHPRSDEEDIERVREWWESAAKVLPEIEELIPVLDDSYE